MEIHISADFDAMSALAARDFLERLSGIEQPLVLLPSGNSPVGFLKVIREHFLQTGTRPNWRFIGLDEWVGIGQDEFGSCREFLDRHLFRRIDIPADRIHFFNGLATDLDAERRMAESVVASHGGIDVAVLGIGTNGHLGLNEPGSDPSLLSQIVPLAPSTIEAARRYFDRPRTVTHGITLGLKTLLASKSIYLLASGHGKASIIQRVVEGSLAIDVPGTCLQAHGDCHLYLDTEAASKLTT
jgi:galactosamine-6-phosphate isomerase